MKLKIASVVLAVGVVTGCSTTAHCVGEFDYQRAYSLQPPDVTGLKMPASSAALVIPPPVNQIVPYAYKTTDGSKGEKKGMQCLDAPPRMSPVAPNKS